MAVRDQLGPWSLGSIDPRQTLAAMITIASLIGVGAEVVYLLQATGSQDSTWSRTVSAFTPLQTIAFAAVGWVFGREVHRQEAQQARAHAKDAETRAQGAEESLVSARSEAATERANAATVGNLVLLKQRKAVRAARASNGANGASSDVQSTAVRAGRGGGTPVGVNPAGGAPTGGADSGDPDLDELADLVRSLYPHLA